MTSDFDTIRAGIFSIASPDREVGDTWTVLTTAVPSPNSKARADALAAVARVEAAAEQAEKALAACRDWIDKTEDIPLPAHWNDEADELLIRIHDTYVALAVLRDQKDTA